MAYSDPQSVTVNSAAVSLPRTGLSLTKGEFSSADRKYRLVVSHEVGSRYRHLAQLRFDDLVANPLVPDQKIAVGAHAHIVVDMPKNGLSASDVVDLAKALVAWATPTNLEKLVSGES